MNTDKIAYFINHPEAISAADVTTIQEVKVKFPYCSTLHMLYIKALAVSNSVHFEEELKKSAIHVNDREKLHELIHLTTAPITDKKEKQEPIVVEKIEEIKPAPVTVEAKEVEIESVPDIVVETEKTDSKKEEIVPIVQKTIEPIIKKEPKPIVAEPKKEKVDMAKIIEDIRLKAEAARNKGKVNQPELKVPIEVELTPTPEVTEEEVIEPPESAFDAVAETTDKVEVQVKDHIIENETLDPNINKETFSTDNQDSTEEERKITEEKPLELDVMAHAMEVAFELDVDNIIKDQSETETTEIKVEEEIQETEITDPNNLSFTDWLKYKQGKFKVKEVTTSEKVKLSKTEIDDLLNKFIEEEPKMSRPQKEFYNPVKNAKKSLDSTTVLVSETLAKIYWMQKNYEKAIRAYEQLSLRNPEKKTFFANQIKQIKKEVK